MLRTCCTFCVKCILNSLNVAFNDRFGKKFNIAWHTSVRFIVNGFNVLPTSLTFVCNLYYMVQNMPEVNKFQQLIARPFLKSDC